MQCTKCLKCLPLNLFSFKNEKQKIYYLHCNKCREKNNDNDKKEREKELYELIKKTNKIQCECGIKYISFREYHIIRHINSNRHLKRINEKNISNSVHN